MRNGVPRTSSTYVNAAWSSAGERDTRASPASEPKTSPMTSAPTERAAVSARPLPNTRQRSSASPQRGVPGAGEIVSATAARIAVTTAARTIRSRSGVLPIARSVPLEAVLLPAGDPLLEERVDLAAPLRLLLEERVDLRLERRA